LGATADNCPQKYRNTENPNSPGTTGNHFCGISCESGADPAKNPRDRGSPCNAAYMMERRKSGIVRQDDDGRGTSHRRPLIAITRVAIS
jgi:hypothetical protein